MNNNINKQELSKLTIANKFTDYLAQLITGNKSFEHSYNIEFKAWKKNSGETWDCDSLLSAKQKYWWHGSYEQNDKKLKLLSNNLRDALDEDNAVNTLYWALRVLEWGDVYKGCTGYILNCYESNSLCNNLKRAVSILDGGEYQVEQFNDNDLRMDSGLTKIYSLASQSSIIMDSRVAAAMTLIATRILNIEEQQKAKKLNLFACGTAQNKEGKKRSFIRGKKVFSRYLSPLNQAHHNLIANWLLKDAIKKSKSLTPNILSNWQVENDTQFLRAIEASLFMIGSDITNG
jgi:hypothetical protein